MNPQREIRPPVRFDEELYAADDLTADINEPRNISEACKNEYCVQWKEATDAEYNSLIENDTWELVPLPEGKNIIGFLKLSEMRMDLYNSIKHDL